MVNTSKINLVAHRCRACASTLGRGRSRKPTRRVQASETVFKRNLAQLPACLTTSSIEMTFHALDPLRRSLKPISLRQTKREDKATPLSLPAIVRLVSSVYRKFSTTPRAFATSLSSSCSSVNGNHCNRTHCDSPQLPAYVRQVSRAIFVVIMPQS